MGRDFKEIKNIQGSRIINTEGWQKGQKSAENEKRCPQKFA